MLPRPSSNRLGPRRGRESGARTPHTAATIAAFLLATVHLAGCSTFFAVPDQQRRAARNAVVGGTVDVDYAARGPLVVGILLHGEKGLELYDHFVAEKPGPWVFAVAPGTYSLAAFEDVNGDGRYDDEPALRIDPNQELRLEAGQRTQGIELRIPIDGRFPVGPFALTDLEARGSADQRHVSLFALSVAGRVTSLDDPRFGRDVADKGMWRYYDFLLEADSGIYFLEEYDADKIPVLFVHGIGGTPRDFELLIDALDRERFQPWVFYYPSGARLDVAATLLTQLFVRLRVEYAFERAAVVAHSMGGLVTRQFLLEDYATNGTEVVQTYMTIASPFGGMSSAGAAIEHSPVVVHSWRGLAPGSEFLEGLFWIDPAKTHRRRLPHHIAYHLLFGFRSGGSSESGDGTVPLVSQLRPEAQEEARTERGYDESHTSILRSPAVAARLNEILEH